MWKKEIIQLPSIYFPEAHSVPNRTISFLTADQNLDAGHVGEQPVA